MRISDWSSDVCSSDLAIVAVDDAGARLFGQGRGQPGDQPLHLVHRLGFGQLVLLGPAVDLAAEIIAGLAVIGQPRRLDVDAVQRGERVDHRKIGRAAIRSEEHTSELQSLMRLSYAVFSLKKKTT